MKTTAINVQVPWEPAADDKLAVRAEGVVPRFAFARARKETPLGPAHYLILLRRQHAGRANLSWESRRLAN